MTIFKIKLHRTIEKGMKLKKNVLKDPFQTLRDKHKFTDQDILRICEECNVYCQENGNDFEVALKLYVSCLNNPKTRIGSEEGLPLPLKWEFSDLNEGRTV